MKEGRLKKILCGIITVAVCLTSIPFTAFADNGDKTDKSVCTAASDGKHVPDMERKEVKKEVTCTEDGEYWLICKLCNQQYLEVVPATGHKAVKDKKVEATCTKEGLTEGSHCSVCGEVLQEQETIPVIAHNWEKGKVIEEASCENSGKKEYTCKNCGTSRLEPIPATGHKAVKDKKVKATCTKDGLTEGSHCSVCGEVLEEQEIIPATEHSWGKGKVIEEASCENSGKKEYTCKDCGKTKTETIAATGHKIVTDEKVDVTCTKEGLSEGSHCSVCGKVIKEQEIIPAAGHLLSTVVAHTEGSCMERERWTYQCLIDGEKWDVTGEYGSHHLEELKAVEPTCTKEGLTAGTKCSVCGTVQKAQETIPAIGHNYVSSMTRDKKAGSVTFQEVCKNCNDVKKGSTIGNLGEITIENSAFYGKDGKQLTEISDKLHIYTGTSDYGRYNVVYADNSEHSKLREFSTETEDGIDNLIVKVGSDENAGTIQMKSSDGITQMNVFLQPNTADSAILSLNENHIIASIKNITLEDNSVRFESENGNELIISSENVKYEVGNLDTSKDSLIVAERVEGSENTVKFSTKSVEALSEEQENTQKEEAKTEESETNKTADDYEPIEIIFSTKTIQEENTEEDSKKEDIKIEKIEDNKEEDNKIEKIEDETPSTVIVKFVDPPKEEEIKKEVKNVTFHFESLEWGCDCGKKCNGCDWKSDTYTHTCKHKNCNHSEEHRYENGKCKVCGRKPKKHAMRYQDEEYDKCVFCGITNKHKWKNNKDGYCKCEKCSRKEKHNYKKGKCTRCGYKHGDKEHEYQYQSLSQKDKCYCGKEVSHKWKNNKDGYCICEKCSHKEKHNYKKGKCTRCGYKHGDSEHKYQYQSLSQKDKCDCGKEVSHKWKNNNDGYCICQNCSHKEMHNYKKGKCTRCGYKK